MRALTGPVRGMLPESRVRRMLAGRVRGVWPGPQRRLGRRPQRLPRRPRRPAGGVLARLARWAAVLGLLVAPAACAGPSHGGTVTIMIPWTGSEFQAFYAVVKQFERETGVHVNVEVTRALTEQLDAAVAAGAPPDLAMLPSVGAVDHYASTKALRRLDVDTSAYVEPFRALATVDGRVYAVPVKADVKSLIWFNPAVMPQPPTTIPELQQLTTRAGRPWCLGLESGPTSGWPGADWIADILLSGRDGADAYRQWLTGRLSWTSDQVTRAWTTWHGLVAGSLREAPVTNFHDAATGMTADPPTCSLDHGGMSAMGFAPGLGQGTDYDYVTTSPGQRLEVSADFVGMFAADNPDATALITYLSGTEAQTAWVRQTGGYAFSADSRVTPGAYPAGVRRRIASMFRPDSGYTRCFSAADMMQPDLSAAFYRAVLDYAGDAGKLRRLLDGLDNVQAHYHSSPVPMAKMCADPP